MAVEHTPWVDVLLLLTINFTIVGKTVQEVSTPLSRTAARDEEGNYLFRREWLANYVVISEPGTYNATVTTEPYLYDPATVGEEGNARYICNVKAVLQSSLPELKELLKGKEFIKADDIQHLFLNGNVWVNEDGTLSGTVPHKKQHVEIVVDYVEGRDGEDVLRITDLFVQAPKNAPKVNLDALFGDE